MISPSSLDLAVAGLSAASVVEVFRRVWRWLPRWKSRRMVYRVPSCSTVTLHGDLWVATLPDGSHAMSKDLHTLEQVLDTLGANVPIGRFPSHGKVRPETQFHESEVTR
jgi:hypothetical protein